MQTKNSTPHSSAAAHLPILAKLGWSLTATIVLPGRSGRFVSPTDLALTDSARRLASDNPLGLYGHQALALEGALAGKDIAIATGTSSGKSLVFQLAVVDRLSRDPSSVALVLYPTRALAEEQYDRWVSVSERSALAAEPALFIGDGLSPAARLQKIRRSRIVVSTPDVVHAWLMQHRNRERSVAAFLRRLRILVVDEAHDYTAVFGSQSAFLFRRLDQAVRTLGGRFQVIAASATMADPVGHLRALTGRLVELVGPEHDASPSHEKRIHFVHPRAGDDLLAGVGSWLRFSADRGLGRFLAFVESRVQAEHFARGAGRRSSTDTTNDETLAPEADRDLETASSGAVRAYRAGYESSYRKELIEDLRAGRLAGLVTTSALELGLDLPALTLGFLIGVPRTVTSLYQRLGRFGRHGPADIFLIADGSAASAQLFAAPDNLLRLPLQSSTLYLDNPRIQYIHVLCHANEERWAESDSTPAEFAPSVDFPPGFVDLCNRELRGETAAELRGLRPSGDELPHLAFPLRDCDHQFVVKSMDRGLTTRLGTLTFAQVLREAYPGAAYWHAGRPYRVRSVQVNRRTVQVVPCSQTFTKPKALPPVLLPDLTADAVIDWRTGASLTTVETQVNARECVSGFSERRGSKVRDVVYPLRDDDPSEATYSNDRFCRHIDTTGVLLSHPCLADASVRISELADCILESYLQLVPIDRQDIAAGTCRVRVDRRNLTRVDRCVAIYDRTYGSLRLSSRLLTGDTLPRILGHAVKLASAATTLDIPTFEALQQLARAAESARTPVEERSSPASANDGTSSFLPVIQPGSCGVHRVNGAVFNVVDIFFAPDGLRYRGRFDHQKPTDLPGHISAAEIVELPGETRLALWDPQSGQLVSN